MEQFKVNLLKLVAEHDLHGEITWDTALSFYVICNDVFAWGCADAEDIESQEDVDLIHQSIVDCQAADMTKDVYALELFCARKRKMRPQGAMYESTPKALWHLFDACGEEREITSGNPRPQPKE